MSTVTPTPLDPQTPEEWQTAVDTADAWLCIDDARSYGLIQGGPEVDRGRCAEVLDRGSALGYRPHADAPELMVAALAEAGQIEREGGSR